MKTDPYAFLIEDAPAAAAIVCNLEQAHHWQDGKWIEQKAPHGPAIFKFDSAQQTFAELGNSQKITSSNFHQNSI
jgi:hypothetical protein